MKPTKNKYYCVSACKPKMKFATFNEAFRFNLFNQQEVGGWMRIYYCNSCMAFHLSSRSEHGEKLFEPIDHKMRPTEKMSRPERLAWQAYMTSKRSTISEEYTFLCGYRAGRKDKHKSKTCDLRHDYNASGATDRSEYIRGLNATKMVLKQNVTQHNLDRMTADELLRMLNLIIDSKQC